MRESPVSVTSTRKSGRRYAATRNDPVTVFLFSRVVAVLALLRRRLAARTASADRSRGWPGRCSCRAPPRAARCNVHSAVLQAFTLTERSSTTLSRLSRTETNTGGALGQQPDAAGRVAAQDRLEVDFFAELVDAAIGEHGAAQQRIGFFEIEVETVFPRQDAVVPVAAGVGDVAVLFRHDEEGEFGPVARIAQPRLRRDRDAVGAGRAGPHRLAVAA